MGIPYAWRGRRDSQCFALRICFANNSILCPSRSAFGEPLDMDYYEFESLNKSKKQIP